MNKGELIQVSISELDSCISKMTALQSASQGASASRMTRPIHTGQASAVAVLESIADVCEQIETAYDTLLSTTIRFLTSAKNAMINADKSAERLVR